jgi:signal transduction histidine kinase
LPILKFDQASRICFALVLAISGIVIFGWFRDIEFLQSAFEVGSSMKLNTALGLGLIACAGLIEIERAKKTSFLKTSGFYVVILIVILITFGSIAEDFFHLNLGFDELFVKDLSSVGSRWAPGRPSPITLLNLMLLVLAFLIGKNSTRLAHTVVLGMVLTGWVVSFQAAVSYILGVNANFGLAVYTQMAIHTAISFSLLNTGFLLRSPQEGFMKIITGSSEACRIVRKLLFFAILLPPGITWVQVWGQTHGYWNREFGAILRIVCDVIVFSLIALKTGSTLLESEHKDQLAQASLLQAIQSRDEFLAIASHELRTPITGMKIRAQAMSRRLEKGDPTVFDSLEVTKLIRQTNEGLNRMTHLVEDVLDISRIENNRLELNLEEVDLNSVTQKQLDFFCPQLIKAGIAPTVEMTEKAIVLKADRSRLEQVLANLITNTIRYAHHAPLRIALSSTPSEVCLIFEDNGPGIAEPDRERVFAKYERLMPSGVSGLGLGLFITHEIIEAHHGTVQIQEKNGNGTRFLIQLPR